MDKIKKKIEARISENFSFLNDKKITIPSKERTLLQLEIGFLKEIKTDIDKLK